MQHSLEVAVPWPSCLVCSVPAPLSAPPSRHPLTCGLPVPGLLQVAQRTRIVTQMVEGNASAVGGLEVALLPLQHLETVLAHPLIVHQLRLQQAGCGPRTGALRACRQPQISHPRGACCQAAREPPPFRTAERASGLSQASRGCRASGQSEWNQPALPLEGVKTRLELRLFSEGGGGGEWCN